MNKIKNMLNKKCQDYAKLLKNMVLINALK